MPEMFGVRNFCVTHCKAIRNSSLSCTPIISKSTGLSNCGFFNLCLVLLPDRFWLSSSLCWVLQSAPNVSHYPVWKPSYSSDSSLQVHASAETWYFIFHSGLWMSLRVDAGSHATARRLPLISLTTTNCGWRTNERIIGRFHGNCHYGPSCLRAAISSRNSQWAVGGFARFSFYGYIKIILMAVSGLEECWKWESSSSLELFSTWNHNTETLLVNVSVLPPPKWLFSCILFESVKNCLHLSKLYTIESGTVLANEIHLTGQISREWC